MSDPRPSLEEGSSLGPYRILDRIGTGAMGEVYRAHDGRLDRDVAVKILPADFATDPERLGRFEQEARAAAALNHPNIVAIHDVGSADGLTYVVMELLEGASLRAEIEARPPTVRKAVEWTIGAAEGLAAAHARGIVHRDIKPDNLFVTADGKIKILDFGIARVVEPDESDDAATVAASTEPGMVMGTAAYMSPEQVRGETVDARSDIFALGVVAYEMLSGEKAFAEATAVETMNAVLTRDLPELLGRSDSISPTLDRVIGRCLEKRAEERFHSAHDLALALDAVGSSGARPAQVASSKRAGVPRWATVVAVLAVMVASAALATWWAGDGSDPPLPTLRQVSFRRGTIDAARYTAAGDSVFYSGRYDGAPSALFRKQIDSPESSEVGPGDAVLMAESGGELAVIVEPSVWSGRYRGRLAMVAAGSRTAREVEERVVAADFVESGIAAVISAGNGDRVEFPLGNVVEETRTGIMFLRASPDGQSVAYFKFGEGIVVRHVSGSRVVLPEEFPVTGLAWGPGGAQVWYSKSTGSGASSLFSFVPGRAQSEAWRSVGWTVLEDIASDGRILVRRDVRHGGSLIVTDEFPTGVDLSWLDASQVVDISRAQDAVLLNAAGGYYLRGLDGAEPIRLGTGFAHGLSRSGEHAVAMAVTEQFGFSEGFRLMPVGVGQPRDLPNENIESGFAWFHPDGEHLVLNGRVSGGTWRYFMRRLDGTGDIAPIGPDNFDHYVGQMPMSEDGRLLMGFPYPDRTNHAYDLETGESIPVQGLEPSDIIIRFGEDGGSVYVFSRAELPARVYRVAFRTGERSLVREFAPADPAGIAGFDSIAMTPDASVIAFNYSRVLSTLYEIDDLMPDPVQ